MEDFSFLKNPDDVQKEVKFNNLDEDCQKNILSLILNDKHFTIQAISLIKPNYFLEQSHSLICKIAFKFFNQYKQLPSKAFLVNEIKETLKDSSKVIYHLGELEAVLSSYIP